MLKVRKTDRQQVLDRSQRKVNLKGAFKTGNCLKVQGKDFLIIDDVWTTGSTLNELSLTLKRSGAHKIYLLTIARKL
jgi:predicted amidophosphoribosyltransferase